MSWCSHHSCCCRQPSTCDAGAAGLTRCSELQQLLHIGIGQLPVLTVKCTCKRWLASSSTQVHAACVYRHEPISAKRHHALPAVPRHHSPAAQAHLRPGLVKCLAHPLLTRFKSKVTLHYYTPSDGLAHSILQLVSSLSDNSSIEHKSGVEQEVSIMVLADQMLIQANGDWSCGFLSGRTVAARWILHWWVGWNAAPPTVILAYWTRLATLAYLLSLR